jgi:GxxExxY protein
LGSFDPVAESDERLAKQVLDAAFSVHSKLGPGLLESVYEHCLCYELTKAEVPFERQAVLAIDYDGVRLDAGLRLDVFVAERVVIELKAVDNLAPIHEAQLFTYLKLTNRRLGLLLNFNVQHFKDGIKRVVR